MPNERGAPDAAHAAAWAVVTAVQLAMYVGLAGVIANAVVPTRLLRPVGFLRFLLPKRLRHAACIAYHATFGGALLVVTAALVYEAALAADAAPHVRTVGEWLCARDALSSVYGRPHLVRAQAALLVLLFVLQFAERFAHLVLVARPVALSLRVARAFGVGGIWVATASAAPLSVPLAVAIGVNIGLDHVAEAASMARLGPFAWWTDVVRAVFELLGGAALVISSGIVLECRAGRRAAGISAMVGFGHALPLCFAIVRASAAWMLIDSERLQRDAKDK